MGQCISCGDTEGVHRYAVTSERGTDTDRLCRPCARDYRRGGFWVRIEGEV